jgi:hypothetical protein
LSLNSIHHKSVFENPKIQCDECRDIDLIRYISNCSKKLCFSLNLKYKQFKEFLRIQLLSSKQPKESDPMNLAEFLILVFCFWLEE